MEDTASTQRRIHQSSLLQPTVMLVSDCILRLNPARNSPGHSALALPQCGGAPVPGVPWPAALAVVAELVVP